MLRLVHPVRCPARVFLLAFAGLDCLAAGVQEQAGEVGTVADHAPQLVVGYLLADHVERQAAGADAAGAVEQSASLDAGREF